MKGLLPRPTVHRVVADGRTALSPDEVASKPMFPAVRSNLLHGAPNGRDFCRLTCAFAGKTR